MSEFRDLQAKLQKIEENYFKDLDIDLQELRRNNSGLAPDELVAFARAKYGQDAASYLSDQLEREADLADYEASDAQPHMREAEGDPDDEWVAVPGWNDDGPDEDEWANEVEGDWADDELDEDAKSDFHNKLKGTHDDNMYVGFGLDQDIEYALGKIGPDLEIHGYDHSDRSNLIKVSVGDYAGNVEDRMYDKDTKAFVDPLDKDFDGWMDQNPFESIDEEDELKGVNDKYDDETLNCKHCGDYFCTSKFGGECPEIQTDWIEEDNYRTVNPKPKHQKPMTPKQLANLKRVMSTRKKAYRTEGIDEGYGEETFSEMKEYWMTSLSQSIVQKGVFTKLYDAAGRDIDNLNAAIEEEAYSIAEMYHGSGEGIGTSDVNHFIAGIGSSLGIDDLFGWKKPKESIEEDYNNISRDRIERFADLAYNIKGNILDRLMLKGRELSREAAEKKLINDGFSISEVQELETWLKKSIENVAGRQNIIMLTAPNNFGGWGHIFGTDKETGLVGIGGDLGAQKRFNRDVMSEFNRIAWVQPTTNTGMKSDEELERDKANRGARFGKAIRSEELEEDEIESFVDRVKRYGRESDDVISDNSRRRQARSYAVSGPSRGRRSYGGSSGSAPRTLGMTEGTFRHEEDPISVQVKSLLAQGKKVMSRVVGAVGEVVKTDGRFLYIKPPGNRQTGVTSFDSKDNVEIEGGVDQYNIISHWEGLTQESALDEARGRVVEVPPELRGTDPDNSLGGTSRDAERFLADLGPDDDVSHDVIDPETGELLDWPTKEILKKQDDEEMDQYWRSQGGTKRERGKAKWDADQERADAYDVPHLYLHSGTSFGSDTNHAQEFMQDLRNSDFYNVVWRNVSDDVDDPDYFMDRDYDVDVEVPAVLKRKDGKKLTNDDHDNIKEIIKAVKAASTMGNLGLGYAGTSGEGTTARFYPSFM